MKLQKYYLEEKCLIFLYILSFSMKRVNINTFKRYLYLYYLSSSFFKKGSEDLAIEIDKGNIEIPYLKIIFNELCLKHYIEIRQNEIIIRDELVENISRFINNSVNKGMVYDLYSEIKPFINLLISYDEEFIFTIFFSEPTFKEANARNLESIEISDSKLAKLLNEFKSRLNDMKIDNYDILAYWMKFILKNYYRGEEKNNE